MPAMLLLTTPVCFPHRSVYPESRASFWLLGDFAASRLNPPPLILSLGEADGPLGVRHLCYHRSAIFVKTGSDIVCLRFMSLSDFYLRNTVVVFL